MTTALNKNPAYKTQWNSVEQDIRNATGIANCAPLCISYLFANTVFRGIPEFVSYFQENPSLDVPAGQELTIWDISVFNENQDARVACLMDGDLSLRIRFLLDTFVSPLGVTLRHGFPGAARAFNQTLLTDKGFSLTRSVEYTLKAERDDLDIRLSDLFRLMVVCKVWRVEFAPQQKMTIWGISDQEQADLSVDGGFERVISRRCVGSHEWEVTGMSRPLPVQNLRTSCKGMQLSGEKFALSIASTPVFANIGDFAERLSLGEIELLPNLKLIIPDENIGAILTAYEKTNGAVGKFSFLLDQMLLPLGYEVEVVGDGEYMTTNRMQLEISSSEGVVLKRRRGELLADFDLLGKLMCAQQISTLSLPPRQPIMIYGFDEGALRKIKDCIDRRDLSATEELFSKVLQKENPLGFSWRYRRGSEISISTMTLFRGSATLEALKFVCLGQLEFSLVRPTGETFIGNIVNHSHPALLDGLREADQSAMKFLLFRAFFYYLCGDFRSWRGSEFPDFFRPEERRLLVPNPQGRMQTEGVDPVVMVNEAGEVFQLIDESTVVKIQEKMADQRFSAAIKELNRDAKNLEKIGEILALAPVEFDKLSLDQLPAPIQLILKEILALVGKEFRKSPFILQHLPAFIASFPPEEAEKERSSDRKDA